MDSRHHGYGQRALLGLRRVDHFVQGHGAVFGHGERGFIGQHDADGPIGAGLQNIALIDGVAVGQFDLGAVGTGRRYRSENRIDLANGFAKNVGIGSGGLGHLGWSLRPGEFAGQLRANGGAVCGNKIGRYVEGKVIGNDNLAAVGPGQDQIGARLAEIRLGQRKSIGQRKRTLVFSKKRHRRVLRRRNTLLAIHIAGNFCCQPTHPSTKVADNSTAQKTNDLAQTTPAIRPHFGATR